MTRQEQTNQLAAMSVLSLTNPAGWTGCSALFILIVLLPEAASDAPNATSPVYGGGSQCGEYTNQVIPGNLQNAVLGSIIYIHASVRCLSWTAA